MTIARFFLSLYRKIQYKIFRRNIFGLMHPGKLCTHDPFEEHINHNDVVHPCVRYIEEGYLGHKWWMVYTPYYASNDNTENPILCYAESNEPVPPTHWRFFCQVQGQPPKGYNSDPTLFYTDGILYVMWRENLTPRCDEAELERATFGAQVVDSGISMVFGPLVGSNEFENDAEVSPTFLQNKNGKVRCLAMNLRFHLSWYIGLPLGMKRIVGLLFNVLDLFGVWGQQKSYGIAQWESDSLHANFKLETTVKFSNCNKLYRPWHMDFFEWNDKLYAIVQSNQCNADICLAESEDGVHFRMYSRPLMTNVTCGKVGIYKPTGGIVNGVFYLYYTAQDITNRKLNKLYLTTLPFFDLIEQIK